jgi:hypothetical protein
MSPWKTDREIGTDECTNTLQWGHGGDAVEDNCPETRSLSAIGLQWGHGGDAVEDLEAPASVPVPNVLQWGHGSDAVENDRVGVAFQECSDDSMGPD